MALKDLIDLMEPPAHPVDPEGDWSAVEQALGTPLPQEYKNFIAIYGSGSINGFLTILNPFSQEQDLNLLHQIEVSRVETQRVRDYFHQLGIDLALSYSLYPPLGGFLPWGRAPNSPWSRGPEAGYRTWCDWVTAEAAPDSWVAAVRFEGGYGSFGSPFVEFLLGVLDDRWGVFAEMEPWPEPAYVSAGTEAPPRRRRRDKRRSAKPAPSPRVAPKEEPGRPSGS